MRVELEQLWSPGCVQNVECSLCGETFTLGIVIAQALTESNMDAGEVCPECALYLAAGPMGRARPDAFPGLAEFRQRLDEWEGPRYASDREFEESLRDGEL